MEPREQDFPLRDFYRKIHTTYDRVNRIFTFGRDRAWRRRAARHCLRPFMESREGTSGQEKIRILDICTGTGDFILELARQLHAGGRDAELTGYDFSGEMLDEARKKLAGEGLGEDGTRIGFEEGDVAHMPFQSESMDAAGITFGIRNLIFHKILSHQRQN